MTTDKPTVEEIRRIHNQQPPSTITRREWEHVDFLLAEVGRLKAELPPHKTTNLLTTPEHQVYRNHQFLPEGCSECSMTETIVKKLREELGL